MRIRGDTFLHLQIKFTMWLLSAFHAGESEQLELCAVVISPQPMIIIESGTKAQLKPSLSFHPHKYFEDCLLPASQHLTFFMFLASFPLSSGLSNHFGLILQLRHQGHGSISQDKRLGSGRN